MNTEFGCVCATPHSAINHALVYVTPTYSLSKWNSHCCIFASKTYWGDMMSILGRVQDIPICSAAAGCPTGYNTMELETNQSS